MGAVTMSYATNALDKLNAITNEQIRDTNYWDEIVTELEGFDQELTDQLDPSGHSDKVGFTDGSAAVYSGGEWVERTQE